METGGRLLVGAIDFGTSYSGWAFSFKHENKRSPPGATVKIWDAGTITTEKTPTCLLLKPDGTFDSFGYDAEKRYGELSAKHLHSKYFFFRHFKMKLYEPYGKGIKRDMMIHDEIGKQFLAIDVFAISLKYLVKDMMETVNQRTVGELLPPDIGWVLTVPAIWSDASKQFMREAAIKAGIDEDQLSIALEPEAASIYCRHLPVAASANETISKLPAGTKYIVLDAGGGTVDITVHEVQESNTLREVRAANGGAWGGTMVNKAFEGLLRDIVGEMALKSFMNDKTEDWLYMSQQFEAKKREIEIKSPRYITLRLPVALIELCEKYNGMQFQDAVAASKYAELVEMDRDKLKLSKVVFFFMFEQTLQKTVDHVKSLFKDTSIRDIDIILMVGGFSESPLLQQALKEAFPNKELVVPSNSSSCVLRGALMYGHSPLTISERILKYTYGVACLAEFREGHHPERKKIITDYKIYCEDVFGIYVTKNTRVKPGKTQVTRRGRSISRYQRETRFRCFISESTHPQYVDEVGCFHIGQLSIRFDQPDSNVGREVAFSMSFGGTDITIEAEDQKTGDKTRAVLDFLG